MALIKKNRSTGFDARDIGLRSDSFTVLDKSDLIYPRVIANVEAENKAGKCVAGDSTVTLASGRSVLVRELIGGERLADGHTVVRAEKDGIRAVSRLTLSDGRYVDATLEHRFYTPDGWCKVEDLVAGSLVAVPYCIPVPNLDQPWNNGMAYTAKVIGYLLADGSISQTSVGFTKNDPEVMLDFCAAVQALGFEVSERAVALGKAATVGVRGRRSGSTSTLSDFRTRWGLYGNAAAKRIPVEVDTWHATAVATLLRSYFTCDGWVSASRTNVQIGCCSASEHLIRQVAHLLLRFGVVGRVRSRVVEGTSYWLWEGGRRAALTFVTNVGFFGQKMDKAKDLLRARQGATLRRYGKLAKGHPGGPVIAPESMWVAVKSVVPGQFNVPVYDVQIEEDDHVFVVNDIITHNTDFCLRHVPDPIVIFNFDRGLRGVVEPFLKQGKRIIVAGIPPTEKTKRVVHPSYHFARPMPERGQGRKSEGYLQRVTKLAKPIWERWIDDLAQFYESQARSGVVDTGGAAFQLGKWSYLGMTNYSTKDDPYGQKSGDMKAIFQGLITDGHSYDKNMLWVHRLKEKWAGGQPSGQFMADGHNQVGYEVEMTIRLSKRLVKNKETRRMEVVRSAEVRDCRLDDRMNGEVFEGKEYAFDRIMAEVTETDLEEWQ